MANAAASTRDVWPPAPQDYSMEIHLERGAAAETLAADYLQAQGLTLYARNVRCKAGEIDLVCYDRGVLVMVEVRLRSRSDFGGALASVSPRKQRKFIRAAQYATQREPSWRELPIRFDVVAIQGVPDGIHSLEWVKDAFRAA
jgi:putative endonuclease